MLEFGTLQRFVVYTVFRLCLRCYTIASCIHKVAALSFAQWDSSRRGAAVVCII